ncbi:hypothetical protein CVD28_04495 [Bacillus sp. M6-12]|uniref:hypothetical protein n=1 Tax=Bacillus sp. M6-12 TaxID=2054166 RepID=UPI000C7739DF|nr:hypothetical protein [Bacillus sp. M6-12]PLS19679.1 hypothetical protein CVD28_04495 [Bacillus sp. M6-12]
MKKVQFLEKACVGVETIITKSMRKLDIFTYTATNHEFGRKQSNGRFNIVTEDEIAKEYLESGKGVFYKGHIYFQEDKMTNSTHFQEFNKKYKRITNELNRKVDGEYQTYLNGALYGAIKDIQHFPMLKSMITLYQTGMFSLEIIELKLQTYLKPEGVQLVLNELYESVEKAG